MKTQIQIEVQHADGELVAECRDALLREAHRQVDKLVAKMKGKNVLFTTRSCAVLHDEFSYPQRRD